MRRAPNSGPKWIESDKKLFPKKIENKIDN